MRLLSLGLFVMAAMLAGCESVSSRVQDRFTGVAPQARFFAANSKAVYDGGLKAVKALEMNIGRTSRASGTIEAYASIRGGDATRDARQTSLQVTVIPADGGETRVELLVKETTEGDFPGGVSQQDLRIHSLYELYFGALERQLLEAGALTAPGKS